MDRTRPAFSRYFRFGGAGLLLFLAGWWYIHIPRMAPLASPAKTPGEPGGLNIRSMDLYGYANSVRQWSLTALDVRVSQDGRVVRSAKVRDGHFYNGAHITARFTAGAAAYDTASKNLDLTGPIQVDAVNGVHLRCGDLHYTQISKRLKTLGPVVITTPQTTFKAGQLMADLALNELTFEKTATQPVVLISKHGIPRPS